ncbi:unnamed protein product [Caenorhabditis brenneri]
MTFEEFTNSKIFKDANFATKISLISSLYGVVSAWEYFTMVNKMANNGGASDAATSSLPANLQNGAVATVFGGMINLNQEPQRKRGFEMDAAGAKPGDRSVGSGVSQEKKSTSGAFEGNDCQSRRLVGV